MTKRESPLGQEWSHHLDLNNTHNSTLWCSKRRPCNRLSTCSYCRLRKRQYLLVQILSKRKNWDLDQFITITLTNFDGSYKDAFQALVELRPRITRYIQRKDAKYLLFTIVAERLTVDDGSLNPIPHFHIITSSLIELHGLKTNLDRYSGPQKLRTHSKAIHNLKGLAEYLLDQNYFKTLALKPRRFRILTTSRGMLVGHPKAVIYFEAINSTALEEAV